MRRLATVISLPLPKTAPQFLKLTRRAKRNGYYGSREQLIGERRSLAALKWQGKALKEIERTVLPGSRSVYPTIRDRVVSITVDRDSRSLRSVTGLGRLREQSELRELRERAATQTGFDQPERLHSLVSLMSGRSGILEETTRSKKRQLRWEYLAIKPKTFGFDTHAMGLGKALAKITNITYPVRLGIRKRMQGNQIVSVTLAVPMFEEDSIREAVGAAHDAGFEAYRIKSVIPIELYKGFLPGSLGLAPYYFDVNKDELEVLVTLLTQKAGSTYLDGNIFIGWYTNTLQRHLTNHKYPMFIYSKEHWHRAYIGTEGVGKTSWANIGLILASDAWVAITAAADSRGSTIRIVHELGGPIEEIGPGATRQDGEDFATRALKLLRSGVPVAIKPRSDTDRPYLARFLAGFLPRIKHSLDEEGIIVPEGTVVSVLVDDLSALEQAQRTCSPSWDDDFRLAFTSLEGISSIGAKPREGSNEPRPTPGISLVVTTQQPEDLDVIGAKFNVRVWHSSRDDAMATIGTGEKAMKIPIKTRIGNTLLLELLMNRSHFGRLVY